VIDVPDKCYRSREGVNREDARRGLSQKGTLRRTEIDRREPFAGLRTSFLRECKENFSATSGGVCELHRHRKKWKPPWQGPSDSN